jgi:hypothetical protein
LLISCWRLIPELVSKVLACAERKKEGEKKITKARRIWEAVDGARRTVVTGSGLKET